MNPKDYIRASNGDGEAVRAIVTEDRGIGNMALVVDSVLNWPHKFFATAGTVVGDEFDPETVTVFRGHLDGSIIMIEEFSPGYSDVGNFENQVVVLKPTTPWADAVAESIGEGGASVTIGDTPPPDAQPGDLWGDTSDDNLQSIVVAVGSLLMPIGHTIITNIAANPATYYGFGTWEEDVKGRVIVGVDTTQVEFNTVNKTGGSKLLQAHSHNLSPGDGNVVHGGASGTSANITQGGGQWRYTNNPATTVAGGGDSQNLQPYKTKYLWTRTA